MDIDRNIALFMGDGDPQPGGRYASFDYCFNYFQAFREQDRVEEIAARGNMQVSCLQLGFYLASWGMFRGQSVLRGRSLQQFRPVVESISTTPQMIWEIDADSYSPDTCRALVDTASDIRRALQFPHDKWPSATLVTKIMLGVFGNVPAFDTWVRAGLRAEGLVGRFGPRALQRIGCFYQDHSQVIDRNRIHTLDFETGKPTRRRYTRAKVIDMIFYVEGGGRGRI
jgi:hypothetical protein